MRVFRHAVASFEPTADGVLLWTRLGDGATDAEWVVSADPDLLQVVARGDARTSEADDHTITVDVDGLQHRLACCLIGSEGRHRQSR
jgi:alkaline phosphatase D